MNIIDPILFQSTLQPKAAAICAPGSALGLISYGRLVQHINNICLALRRLGLGPGKTVAVSIEDPIFHIAITLSLARLGIISVSKYDERVLHAVKIDALIADKPPISAKIDQIILADLSWTRGDGNPLEPHEVPQTSPNDICRIILTSGSTGDPKAVAFSHNMLVDRVNQQMITFGSRVGNCSRIYSDLPVSTMPGFRMLLLTLWRGGIIFLPGDTFESTIATFEEYRVQCILSSPGGLEAMLKGYQRYPTLRSDIEVIIVPGASLPKALANGVCARICPHVINAYGATETGTNASAPVQLMSEVVGAVGFVTPGVLVEIVDDVGKQMPPGMEGYVRIKSRCVARQYVGDPQASANAFRDGCFYPGDIGALEATNLLRIVGRRDNLLNLGGDKINPETIDRVLASCAGVTECASFGVPNEFGIETIWVALVADESVKDEQLRVHCQAKLPAQFRPTRFIRVEGLPRNDMGKVDRNRLLEVTAPATKPLN